MRNSEQDTNYNRDLSCGNKLNEDKNSSALFGIIFFLILIIVSIGYVKYQKYDFKKSDNNISKIKQSINTKTNNLKK